MKISILSLAAAPILASGLLMAQAEAPAAPAQQHRQWHRGQMFDRFATKLNLTEDQKQQAKAILQSARESAKPIRTQLHQTRAALREAVKTGKSDAAIDQISANAGSLMGQLTANRTKAFAKIYALLTPEQRTTADQMRDHMRNRFGAGRPQGSGAGAGF